MPVSASKLSNVPEYDHNPNYICNSEQKKLIKPFAQTILNILLKQNPIIIKIMLILLNFFMHVLIIIKKILINLKKKMDQLIFIMINELNY